MVRKGSIEDISAALELIRELAEYEHAPAEVVVNEAEMQRWGFGPEKVFDFFVCEAGGKIVGLALYYYKYSTWKGKCIFLEDIIVTRTERGKGYGTLLFEKMIALAKEQRVRRLEWQVLEWNEDAIRFYKKYDCEMDGEWINCKLTDELLKRQ